MKFGALRIEVKHLKCLQRGWPENMKLFNMKNSSIDGWIFSDSPHPSCLHDNEN